MADTEFHVTFYDVIKCHALAGKSSIANTVRGYVIDRSYVELRCNPNHDSINYMQLNIYIVTIALTKLKTDLLT